MATDLEISKALALAIGWPEDMLVTGSALVFVEFCPEDPGWDCQMFDYRDWNVIGPIAEKFDCFPAVAACHGDEWLAYTPGPNLHEVYADTPQKAIAMTVIAAKGGNV